MHMRSQRIEAGWVPVWIALLVAVSAGFSLGFACATPFAALAATAALTVSRRDALLLVGVAWLANQAIGFGVLHYPWTADCFVWGAGIGIAALLSVLGAGAGARSCAGFQAVASAVAFLCTFAVYEGLLFAISVSFESGVEAYAPEIVARIFAINAVAFVGLLAASAIGKMVGSAVQPRRELAAVKGHG